MGVHRKKVKFKEVVQLGASILFIKEKGVELQGRTNCGEVTRKYRRKIKENEGYLLRSV